MRKAILVILLTIMTTILIGNASATISIDSPKLTCNPVNPATGNCYNYSNLTVTFAMNDSNYVKTIADGNLQRWQPVVKILANCDASYSTTVTPLDTNLASTAVCDLNFATAKDNNFLLARNCRIWIPYVSALANGSYCLDMNVQECSIVSGASCVNINGGIPSDKNVSITFSIDRALMSSSNRALVNIIPIALIAGAIIIIVGGLIAVKSGMQVAAIVPGLIGLLVALIVITLLIAVIAGSA